MVVKYWSNAFVMPDVGTWCNKERLAWLADFSTLGSGRRNRQGPDLRLLTLDISSTRKNEKMLCLSLSLSLFSPGRGVAYVSSHYIDISL